MEEAIQPKLSERERERDEIYLYVVNIFSLNPEICNQKTNFPSGIRNESWGPQAQRPNE